MDQNKVEEILNSIENGSHEKISFVSELPLKAASKKEGHLIKKFTETTALFGIPYSELPDVKAYNEKRLAEGYQPTERANNYEPIIAHKLYRNSNTGKTYVRFITEPNCVRITKYLIDGNEYDHIPDDIKDWVINSYWKKPDDTEEKVVLPIMQSIPIENVLNIKF